MARNGTSRGLQDETTAHFRLLVLDKLSATHDDFVETRSLSDSGPRFVTDLP